MAHTGFVRKCPSSGVDINLWYDTLGDPSNPALLFIMGLNGQAVLWDPDMLQMFVEAGYYCIIFDNRDVGLSTKIEGKPCPSMFSVGLVPKWLAWFETKLPYTLEDMADDCVALLDHLKVAKATPIGVSMGGMIGQLLAVRHPTRCSALVSIMSTTGGPDLPGSPLWAKLEFTKAPKSSGPEDLVDFRLAMQRNVLMYGAENGLEFDEKYFRAITERSVKRSTYRAGLSRQTAAILRASPREAALRQLAVPTLVIHGDKDVLFPVEHGKRTAEVIPGAKFVAVDGMAHGFPPAIFERLLSEISTFLKESRVM